MSEQNYNVKLEISREGLDIMMEFDTDREGIEAIAPQIQKMELMNREIMRRERKPPLPYHKPYILDKSGVVQVVKI